MLKHLSGIKRVGQTPEEDAQAAADIIAEGGGTAGVENSFDWVQFTDALGNAFAVGLDAYGNYLIASATAEQMANTPTANLGNPTGSGFEPEGYISETDTQMFLYVALIGMGLIFLSRKL